MKRLLAALFALPFIVLQAQVNPQILALSEEVAYDREEQVVFIKFRAGAGPLETNAAEFILSHFAPGENTRIEEFQKESDALGYTHRRFKIYSNNTELYNKVILSHAQNGRLVSLNGDLSLNTKSKNGF